MFGNLSSEYLCLFLPSRACLRPLPGCWLHLHRLHHPRLSSGCLLLHLLETQGALAAADPLLTPQLSDGDPPHDLDFCEPQGTFQAVQHGHQLQLHGGLHPKVLLCPGRARLPGSLTAPTLHHRPPDPLDPAVRLPGVTPVLRLPAPAGAPTAREELSRLQFQLTGRGCRSVIWSSGAPVDACCHGHQESQDNFAWTSDIMEGSARKPQRLFVLRFLAAATEWLC